MDNLNYYYIRLMDKLYLFWFLFLVLKGYSQDLASKDYYLVDSLPLQSISKVDRTLIDSALLIYYNSNNDTSRVNAISIIVEDSWDDAIWPLYNRWIYNFAVNQLKMSLDTNTLFYFQKILASASNNIGYLYLTGGQTEKALRYYLKGLDMQQEIDDKIGMASSLINIGYIYNSQGLIEKALEFYYKSLVLEEYNKNLTGIATALNGIGYIYYTQGETEKALENYTRSLAIREKLVDKYGIATNLNNIGLLFKDNHQWEKALEYYQKGLKLEQEIGDKKGMATSLTNIGLVYDSQEHYEKALKYYLKGLEIRRDISDKQGIAHSLNSIAGIMISKGNYTTARNYAEQSLALAYELRYPEFIQNAASNLTEIAQKNNKWHEAFTYYKLYVAMHDSILNEETTKASIHKAYQYKYEKKALEDSVRNMEVQKVMDAQLAASESEKEQHRLQTEKQKQQSYFLFAGFVLSLFFGTLIYSRLKLIKKQKNIIENQKLKVVQQNKQLVSTYQQLAYKNKEILNSIKYAWNIQQALLKNEKPDLLPQNKHFILYKPKDIIGGDFYWIVEKEDYIFIAVGDCTGHGVPGAMLSMMGISILNELFASAKLYQPAELLNEMRKQVIRDLSLSDMDSVNIGVDLAIVRIKRTTNELQYAGAKRPLYLFINHQLQITKGDNQDIGYARNAKPFTNHVYQLNLGDYIYIFTDGYSDQFGGPEKRKFRNDPFKQLLLKIHKKSMAEQKHILLSTFNDWMQDEEQVDDVCIVGVKV